MPTRARLLLLILFTATCSAWAQVPLDQPPQVMVYRMPELPRELREIPGQVVFDVTINAHGFVTRVVHVEASNPELVIPCFEALKRWQYSPHLVDLAAVPATFRQTVNVGHETLSLHDADTTPAQPRRRTSPQIPPDLLYLDAEIMARLTVGPDGRIAQASVVVSDQPALDEAVLTAARRWTFTPATRDGQPVESNVLVPFVITGDPRYTPPIPADAILADNAELIPVRQVTPRPGSDLADATGNVEIAFAVGTDGRVISAQVRSADDPRLGELARQAVLRWRYRPVVRDGQAIVVRAVQPFHFDTHSTNVTAQKVDRLPRPRRSIAPRKPAELTGVDASATVLFLIDAQGRVTDALIQDVSHDMLVEPVLAAARQWTFHPAVKDGQPVAARVIVPILFRTE